MEQALMGFARVDITPTADVELVGFGPRRSTGVARPLIAQVSAWRLADETCCLAAIDHIGFHTAHADALRDDISALFGAARERVMLCFSHTHSAPNDTAEPEYFAFARARILDCARAALADMRPVKAVWGNARADIGLNRRPGGGALDSRLGVLKIADAATGEARLLVLRLTAHANSLKADNSLVSPDYFVETREALSERFGCDALLTQGASGNVAPKYFASALTPPDAADARFVRSESATEDMAREIVRAVGEICDSLIPRPITRLGMYSVRVPLFADVPSPERAREVALEARRETGVDPTGWLAEVERLNEAGVRRQESDAFLQYFALNEGALCGVPNEIMCEFALEAAARLENDFFYLGGYTNGCTGYFPTAEEFDLGGYEVYWSMLFYYIYFDRVFPLRRESAALLVDAAVNSAPARKSGVV